MLLKPFKYVELGLAGLCNKTPHVSLASEYPFTSNFKTVTSECTGTFNIRLRV